MEKIDPRSLLIKVAEILDRLKIPYMVTGGIAVLVWGRPRFTADIDIIIEMKETEASILEKALLSISEYGYVSKEAMVEALKSNGEFNFIDGYTGVKVDFWTTKNKESNAGFKRKKAKTVLGQKIYFISPEDLILSKLRWYKISPSSRHLEDIESILKISGRKLDKKYLKRMAIKSGVLDELNNLLK